MGQCSSSRRNESVAPAVERSTDTVIKGLTVYHPEPQMVARLRPDGGGVRAGNGGYGF